MDQTRAQPQLEHPRPERGRTGGSLGRDGPRRTVLVIGGHSPCDQSDERRRNDKTMNVIQYNTD